MTNDIPITARRPVSARDGTRLGALSGLLGTLGMTVVTAILVGIGAGISEGPKHAFGVGLIYLFLGSFFAVLIGPAGGAIIGRTLAVAQRTSSAPLVAALTPPAVIVPIQLGWILIDSGSQIDAGAVAIVALGIFYMPFGYLAGKFYARKTNELSLPLG